MTATSTPAAAAPSESWSARFSAVARSIAAAARSCGLEAPGFRSPPRTPDVSRSLRRWPDGRCVVAVRAAGRPFDAVVDDLVEGVIAANGLAGQRADDVRQILRTSVRQP